MENMTAVVTATDEQLLTAADATAIDLETTDAPSIVLGEPCDV